MFDVRIASFHSAFIILTSAFAKNTAAPSPVTPAHAAPSSVATIPSAAGMVYAVLRDRARMHFLMVTVFALVLWLIAAAE
jgi:hypothetical protein